MSIGFASGPLVEGKRYWDSKTTADERDLLDLVNAIAPTPLGKSCSFVPQYA